MKIEKLYTLSQLVEYLYSEHEMQKVPTVFSVTSAKAYYFDVIVNYMQFLQQPLKKEMFVNEAEMPDYQKYELLDKLDKFDNDYKVWQEAEKKVMFDCVVYPKQIIFEDYSLPVSIFDFPKDDISLLWLAEKTNGELKLKNVEL